MSNKDDKNLPVSVVVRLLEDVRLTDYVKNIYKGQRMTLSLWQEELSKKGINIKR